jgi:hypothetical protein
MPYWVFFCRARQAGAILRKRQNTIHNSDKTMATSQHRQQINKNNNNNNNESMNFSIEVAVVQMILELTGGVEHTSSSTANNSKQHNNNNNIQILRHTSKYYCGGNGICIIIYIFMFSF